VPDAWFDPDNADTEGPIAGMYLDRDKYDELLGHYYDIRGYDDRGIPTRATLEQLGLTEEAARAEAYASLT
jgi:aldehyde:ferredoxin oxidoreductase